MALLDWIDLFTPRCTQCNRKVRNAVACRACAARCCSDNCFQKHLKARHGDILDQQAELQRKMRREQDKIDELEDIQARAALDLHAKCPSCTAELRIPRKLKGKSISCPHCGVSMLVPEVEVAKAPTPPLPWWRWKIVQGLFAWAVIIAVCAGVPRYLAWRQDEKLRQADALYEQGKRAEAADLYKAAWVQAKDQVRTIKRIVEAEVERGDLKEAAKWVKMGVKYKVEIDYDSKAAKELLEKAKAGQ
jgi:hypothetical protein